MFEKELEAIRRAKEKHKRPSGPYTRACADPTCNTIIRTDSKSGVCKPHLHRQHCACALCTRRKELIIMEDAKTYVRTRFTPNKVKAIQYVNNKEVPAVENARPVMRWANSLSSIGESATFNKESGDVSIHGMLISVGEWLVYDEDGHLYRMPDHLFQLNYGDYDAAIKKLT